MSGRPIIATTQRVIVGAPPEARRDALDQKWTTFLAACGFSTLPLPNNRTAAEILLADIPVAGLLITGGNDLAVLGGDAPERDETEFAALEWARAKRIPVLAVCRGMQVLQHAFGVPLAPVEGHVTPAEVIDVDGTEETVNSFHRWGTRETAPELEVWAVAKDGIVKAVRHRTERIVGMMWHPERDAPFRPHDIARVRTFLTR